jgi:N-terminal domain of anti-restriction factor ArdC
MAQNFMAPIWMTFKQAVELDAHIRKGERGSLVVYALQLNLETLPIYYGQMHLPLTFMACITANRPLEGQ